MKLSFIVIGKELHMSIFEDAPEFIQLDVRQSRRYNPVTIRSLTSRCEAMLPPKLVQGKSVLDLGSYLGAMGHWALSMGAHSYHGIEIQETFATQSKQLLSRWGEKATIVHSDIKTTLKKMSSQKFDIVIAAGILHTFIDPQVILVEICRLSTQTLLIESTCPPAVRHGKIPIDEPVIVLEHAACNVAEKCGEFFAPTALLSPAAIDWICNQHGFVHQEVKIDNLCDETIAYQTVSEKEVLPFRYLCRYDLCKESKSDYLEEVIKNNDHNYYQDWKASSLNKRCKIKDS